MGGFDLYVHTHSHAGGAGDNVCSACRSNVQGQEKLKTNVKNYKKVLGIFKAFVNVFFLAISAVSMAGIATGETSLVKWIVFGVTFFVALMQLVLKITKFVMKQVRKAVGKKFKVEIHKFVDGKKKKKSIADSVTEHDYNNK